MGSPVCRGPPSASLKYHVNQTRCSQRCGGTFGCRHVFSWRASTFPGRAGIMRMRPLHRKRTKSRCRIEYRNDREASLPFTGLRPAPNAAADVAAPPYDVMSFAESEGHGEVVRGAFCTSPGPWRSIYPTAPAPYEGRSLSEGGGQISGGHGECRNSDRDIGLAIIVTASSMETHRPDWAGRRWHRWMPITKCDA